MAEVNRVEVNGETLIDLSTDTVTAETLDEGITAHDAAGNLIKGTRQTTIAWDNVTEKPFEGGTLPYVEWDGDSASADVVYDGGTYSYYRVSTAYYETFSPLAYGRLTVIDNSGNYIDTEIGGSGPHFEKYAGSNYSYILYVPYGSVLIINEPAGTQLEGLPNGIYYSKNSNGYVWLLLLYDYVLTVPETLKLESLPKSAVTIPNGTAADMVPVSNGAGGVTWVSRDELSPEEELPPDSDIVVEPGEPGWTYVPSVSAEGDLSFTPTQYGADDPPAEVLPVNIRGPRGPAYELTEEDKAAIVEAVKAEPLFEIDNTLRYEGGTLGVNTATDAEQDNTLPITSAAVYETLGNIEILLGTI